MYPEKLSELGGLSELSAPELSDHYCAWVHTNFTVNIDEQLPQILCPYLAAALALTVINELFSSFLFSTQL